MLPSVRLIPGKNQETSPLFFCVKMVYYYTNVVMYKMNPVKIRKLCPFSFLQN